MTVTHLERTDKDNDFIFLDGNKGHWGILQAKAARVERFYASTVLAGITVSFPDQGLCDVN